MIADCGREMTGPNVGVEQQLHLASSHGAFLRFWTDMAAAAPHAIPDGASVRLDATVQWELERDRHENKTSSVRHASSEAGFGTDVSAVSADEKRPAEARMWVEGEPSGAQGSNILLVRSERLSSSPLPVLPYHWLPSGIAMPSTDHGRSERSPIHAVDGMRSDVSSRVIDDSGAGSQSERIKPASSTILRGRMVQAGLRVHSQRTDVSPRAVPTPLSPFAAPMELHAVALGQVARPVSVDHAASLMRPDPAGLILGSPDLSAVQVSHVVEHLIADDEIVRVLWQRDAQLPMGAFPHSAEAETSFEGKAANGAAQDASHLQHVQRKSGIMPAEQLAFTSVSQKSDVATSLEDTTDIRHSLAPVLDKETQLSLMADWAQGLVLERKADQLASWPRPVHLARFQPDIRLPLVALVAAQRGTKVQIALEPSELGLVRIALHSAETGLQVQISAERPEALELMRRHADILSRDLMQMGLGDVAMQFSQDGQNGGCFEVSRSQQQPLQEPAALLVRENPCPEDFPAQAGQVDMRI